MKLPGSLKNAVASGDLVPFIGSGASLAVKRGLFPTWADVLNRLAEELEAEDFTKERQLVDTLIALDRYLDAAEEAIKPLRKRGFARVMKELFQKNKPQDRVGALNFGL